MTFSEAIETCLKKYASFSGTASRSEYWWFYLFTVLLMVGCIFISETLQMVVSLALLLPSIAAGTRRLHDTDRSGWWQLLWLVPLIGFIVLIVFLVQDSRPNRYEGGLVTA